MTNSVYHPYLNAIYRNTDVQFWLLQIIGWFGLSLISFLSLTLWYDQQGSGYIGHTLLQSALGVLVSWPLRYLFHFFWNDILIFRISSAIAGIIGCSLIWTILRISTFMSMTGEQDIWSDFGGWLFGSILIFLCWVAFYHFVKYYQLLQNQHQTLLELASDTQQEQLKRLQAETIAHEAQLKMLRYQLNPHFLFNTLNAISALVKVNESSKAHEMIVQLSNFLRYSLDNDPINKVSLRQEIDAVKQYLKIERTRFGERLKLHFDVPQICESIDVPSLILQPLVENAIKFGIAPSVSGGKVSIVAIIEDSYLITKVIDTGPGMNPIKSPIKSAGIGLKNTDERLREFYNDDYELNLDNTSDGGLCVTLKIPIDHLSD
ncbi:MAG: histidine kinase [Porticoccaceae bacterium]|nr:histidine kinase [Porticoccaceae bacterium]